MKSIELFWHTFFVVLSIMSLAIFQFTLAYADTSEPVEIGSSCSDADAIYHLTTDIQKTPWQLSELYAVPIGTLSPEAWEMSSSFNAQFLAELQSGESAAAYAQACAAIWQTFFANEADVIVRMDRTISATDQVLQCISGNWVFVSTEYLDFEDISDWLTVNGSPFDVTNPSSASVLNDNLQNLLDNLNAQPGAVSEP